MKKDESCPSKLTLTVVNGGSEQRRIAKQLLHMVTDPTTNPDDIRKVLDQVKPRGKLRRVK